LGPVTFIAAVLLVETEGGAVAPDELIGPCPVSLPGWIAGYR
jgi:hypothetical protein